MSGAYRDAIRHMLEEISRDDLPETWRPLADAIGIENVVELCQRFGGTSLYVPKVDSILYPIKRRAILKEFNGSNYKDLAKRYGISERSIYDIVAEERFKRDQPSLFD